MILFTSDIDWAPDEVIEYMLNIFTEYDIPCTLFCTHESKVLRECNRDLFEIGVHPNFNNLLFASDVTSADEILKDILNIYPEAIGVRSHGMTQSTPLLALFKQQGLKYDSNQFFPYQFNLSPYDCWTGLKRIPYNWEDDIHFSYGKGFEEPIIGNNNNGNYFVLDFHPIHVFLNTDSQKTYDSAKPFYQQPDKLFAKRNVKRPGACDLLIATLKEINARGLKSYRIKDVLDSTNSD